MAQAKPRTTVKEAVQQDAPNTEPRPVVWPDLYLHRQQFERVKSLREAKMLLQSEPATSIITKGETPPPHLTDMIRLAHYIQTGRDYNDRAELTEETNS